jgi:hypothetical protein
MHTSDKAMEADVGYRLHVTFIDKDGERHTFEVAKGDNLLDIAQANDLEMEGEWNLKLSLLILESYHEAT